MVSTLGAEAADPGDGAVDTLTDAAILQLRRTLQAIHGDGAHPLAIFIDPLPDFYPQDWTEALEDTALQRIVLPFSLLTHPGLGRPWLLLVPDEAGHERLVSATLRRAVEEALGRHDTDEGFSPRSVCAWLTPPPGAVGTHWATAAAWAHQAASHMARQASVWLPAEGATGTAAEGKGAQRVQRTWRFWDPRGVPLHGPAFTPAQWLQLRGPVHRWFYLAQRGTGCLLAEGVGQGRVEESYSPDSLDFDPGQLALLQRIGLIHKVRHLAPQWAAQDEDDPPTAPPEVAEVDAVLARAQRHGLRDETDMLRFAHCAFTLHPQFDQHPAVTALLEELRRQGHPDGAFDRGMQPVRSVIQQQLDEPGLQGGWASVDSVRR